MMGFVAPVLVVLGPLDVPARGQAKVQSLCELGDGDVLLLTDPPPGASDPRWPRSPPRGGSQFEGA